MSQVFDTAAALSPTETIREFYIRIDAGREDVFDLFTPDFEFFFPKFGIGHGRSDLEFCAGGLGGSMKLLTHDLDSLCFTEGPTRVAVEGFTAGETAEGNRFQGGSTPGGRYCSVFDFEGGLISRMYIYLDPDYGSADSARFHWGREGRTW